MPYLPAAIVSRWSKCSRPLAIVVAAALFITSPFLTTRGLGTSEAYNYSLAVADGVTQMRAGVFPVLVGQSEYAWNGRIHPLRTAPYFVHAAGLIDLLTGRTLGFWTLQNLVVGLSLFSAVLSAYLCLRGARPELDPVTAALLAAAFGLSPGLLATVYAMDLYMTVAAAPWIPLVFGGLARAQREGSFGAFAQTVTGLAGAWLAHPPVAFWLSLCAAAGGLVVLATAPSFSRALSAAAGAVILFFALAGVAFISALNIHSYGDISAVKNIDLLLHETHRAFLSSLQPISAQADQLGDFQLGYVHWALLAAALVLAVWRHRALPLIFLASAGFLLALTTPVPGIQAWLWFKLPTAALSLTNQWPMQRLYLIITGLVIFAFALVWQKPQAPRSRTLRDAASCLLALAAVWTVWQAGAFVSRGFRSRLDAVTSLRVHRSENADLTITSYSQLTPPSWFINGVMDPESELRLLAPFDARELLANSTVPYSQTAGVGVFRAAEVAADRVILAPTLKLQAGRRYRLSFAFLTPPGTCILQMRGKTFFREYVLPSAGNPRGFGMAAGNRRSLDLWTTDPRGDEVELSLASPGIEGQSWLRFAEFRLESTLPSQLPMVLESFIPLIVRVHAPQAAYLEVPRVFVAGYRASVNGRPSHVQSSPDGLVLVPVPAGESSVVVNYPGVRGLRELFWVALAAWAAVAAAAVLPSRAKTAICSAAAGVARRLWQVRERLFVGAGVAAAIALAAWEARAWWRNRQAAGPIGMEVVFPRDSWLGSQPLLVTGRPFAGAFVYVRYEDPRHIRFGFDVWSRFGRVSEPIETDYYAVHRIEISTGALFPSGNSAVERLSKADRDFLRKRLRVVFDGRVVFDESFDQYETRLSDITVGVNRIGGSNAGLRFTGEILDLRRLPVSR